MTTWKDCLPVQTRKVEIHGYPELAPGIMDDLVRLKFPPETIVRVDNEVSWSDMRSSLGVRPAKGQMVPPAFLHGIPASLASLTGELLNNLSGPDKTLPEVFERFSRGGKDAELRRALQTLFHLGVISQHFVNRLPPLGPSRPAHALDPVGDTVSPAVNAAA